MEKSVDNEPGPVENVCESVGSAVESPESRGSSALSGHRQVAADPQCINTVEPLDGWDAGGYPQNPQGLLTLLTLKERSTE